VRFVAHVILKFLFILGFCLEERCALEFREVIAEFLRGKKLAHFSNERGQFGGELRPLLGFGEQRNRELS
jgi:hypothetical protein